MLTGRTRHRIGFRKSLVLMVEEWVYPIALYGFTLVEAKRCWRDATVEDMQAIERGDVVQDDPGPKRRRPLRPKPDSRTSK